MALRGHAAAGASTGGQWDKLSSIFEDRVARALQALGVPSAQDLDALVARVDALTVAVQQLSAVAASSKTIRKASGKAAGHVDPV